MNKDISDHITYAEATKSQAAIRHGLDNIPTEKELKAMRNVATIFEAVRLHFTIERNKNTPIAITSFFRALLVNRKIGSTDRSQHPKGEAIDMDADVFKGCTNKQIFDYIRFRAEEDPNFEFDQLIWEYGTDTNPDWVHVSKKLTGKNRNQILRVTRVDGKSVYSLWKP